MQNLQVVKTFTNTTAAGIPAHCPAAYGANDGEVALAVDGSKPFAGVAVFGCSGAGDALGIYRSGPNTQVTAGAAINPGDFLTANAEGKAVKAVAGDFYFGVADESGAEDDIILYAASVGLLPADATP